MQVACRPFWALARVGCSLLMEFLDEGMVRWRTFKKFGVVQTRSVLPRARYDFLISTVSKRAG